MSEVGITPNERTGYLTVHTENGTYVLTPDKVMEDQRAVRITDRDNTTEKIKIKIRNALYYTLKEAHERDPGKYKAIKLELDPLIEKTRLKETDPEIQIMIDFIVLKRKIVLTDKPKVAAGAAAPGVLTGVKIAKVKITMDWLKQAVADGDASLIVRNFQELGVKLSEKDGKLKEKDVFDKLVIGATELRKYVNMKASEAPATNEDSKVTKARSEYNTLNLIFEGLADGSIIEKANEAKAAILSKLNVLSPAYKDELVEVNRAGEPPTARLVLAVALFNRRFNVNPTTGEATEKPGISPWTIQSASAPVVVAPGATPPTPVAVPQAETPKALGTKDILYAMRDEEPKFIVASIDISKKEDVENAVRFYFNGYEGSTGMLNDSGFRNFVKDKPLRFILDPKLKFELKEGDYPPGTDHKLVMVANFIHAYFQSQVKSNDKLGKDFAELNIPQGKDFEKLAPQEVVKFVLKEMALVKWRAANPNEVGGSWNKVPEVTPPPKMKH